MQYEEEFYRNTVVIYLVNGQQIVGIDVTPMPENENEQAFSIHMKWPMLISDRDVNGNIIVVLSKYLPYTSDTNQVAIIPFDKIITVASVEKEFVDYYLSSYSHHQTALKPTMMAAISTAAKAIVQHHFDNEKFDDKYEKILEDQGFETSFKLH